MSEGLESSRCVCCVEEILTLMVMPLVLGDELPAADSTMWIGCWTCTDMIRGDDDDIYGVSGIEGCQLISVCQTPLGHCPAVRKCQTPPRPALDGSRFNLAGTGHLFIIYSIYSPCIYSRTSSLIIDRYIYHHHHHHHHIHLLSLPPLILHLSSNSHPARQALHSTGMQSS